MVRYTVTDVCDILKTISNGRIKLTDEFIQKAHDRNYTESGVKKIIKEKELVEIMNQKDGSFRLRFKKNTNWDIRLPVRVEEGNIITPISINPQKSDRRNALNNDN